MPAEYQWYDLFNTTAEVTFKRKNFARSYHCQGQWPGSISAVTAEWKGKKKKKSVQVLGKFLSDQIQSLYSCYVSGQDDASSNILDFGMFIFWLKQADEQRLKGTLI